MSNDEKDRCGRIKIPDYTHKFSIGLREDVWER